MVTSTPQQGLPIPDASDNPNVPVHMANLANALEKKLFQVYVSTAARDTAVTTPVEGQICYITGTNTAYIYQDAAWVVFPPQQTVITSGSSVPSNGTGNNGDVFFKV